MITFLIVAGVGGLLWFSWAIHRSCTMAGEYSPYNGMNWIILLAGVLGPVILGIALLPFAGIGMYLLQRDFWICSCVASVLIVLIRNIKNSGFWIGLFSTITLIPYVIIAFFLACSVADGFKRYFSNNQ